MKVSKSTLPFHLSPLEAGLKVTGSRRAFLKTAGVLPAFAGGGFAPFSPSLPEIEQLRKKSRGEVTLTLVGDLFLTEALPSDLGPDSNQVFELLRQSDLGFANLENGLSTVGSPELGGFVHGPSLRGDPSLVSELKKMGIGVVSLANNHTGNYGRQALLQTVDSLDQAGVFHAGAGRNEKEAFSPVYLQKGDVKIAFLSLYSYFHGFEADDRAAATEAGIACSRSYDVLLQLGSGYETGGMNAPPYLLQLKNSGYQSIMAPSAEDIERMKESIREARRNSDLVILSMHFHWGRHGKRDIPLQQQTLARIAMDSGVDLLVGHGPHVIRGVELHQGKVAAYSLGNFTRLRQSVLDEYQVESPEADPSREGLMLRATISGKKLTAVEFLPVVIGEQRLPRFAEGSEGQRIIRILAGLSAQHGAEIQTRQWFGTLALSDQPSL